MKFFLKADLNFVIPAHVLVVRCADRLVHRCATFLLPEICLLINNCRQHNQRLIHHYRNHQAIRKTKKEMAPTCLQRCTLRWFSKLGCRGFLSHLCTPDIWDEDNVIEYHMMVIIFTMMIRIKILMINELTSLVTVSQVWTSMERHFSSSMSSQIWRQIACNTLSQLLFLLKI